MTESSRTLRQETFTPLSRALTGKSWQVNETLTGRLEQAGRVGQAVVFCCGDHRPGPDQGCVDTSILLPVVAGFAEAARLWCWSPVELANLTTSEKRSP